MVSERVQRPEFVLHPEAGEHQRIILGPRARLEQELIKALDVIKVRVVGQITVVVPDESVVKSREISDEDKNNECSGTRPPRSFKKVKDFIHSFYFVGGGFGTVFEGIGSTNSAPGKGSINQYQPETDRKITRACLAEAGAVNEKGPAPIDEARALISLVNSEERRFNQAEREYTWKTRFFL